MQDELTKIQNVLSDEWSMEMIFINFDNFQNFNDKFFS